MNTISDCPHTVCGLEVAIGDLHDAALVGGHADILKAKAIRIRTAADRHDDYVCVQRLGVAAIGRLHGEFQLRLHLLDAGHFLAEAEGEALLLEDTLGFLGDLAVGARHDAVKIFDHGHFGAEAGPDRAHFKADDAGADQDEALRHGGQRQGAGIRYHALFVDLDARQADGFGTGGNDDVLRFEGLRAAIVQGRFDLARAGDLAAAHDVVDLVFLEEEFDPFGQAFDGFVFLGHHLGDVDFQLAGLDAHPGEVFLRTAIKVRCVEEGFGGDTADIQAGTAQRAAGFDTGNLQPELSCADRAIVAAGAATDDDDVIGLCHGKFCLAKGS